jgi:hypothetical protein
LSAVQNYLTPTWQLFTRSTAAEGAEQSAAEKLKFCRIFGIEVMGSMDAHLRREKNVPAAADVEPMQVGPAGPPEQDNYHNYNAN